MIAPPPIDAVQTLALPRGAVIAVGFKPSGFGGDPGLHALHKDADLKSVSVTPR